jgi:hypothetical protein
MMFEIKNKQILAQSIKQIEVSAPELAAKAQAGQFVILRIDETGERIPLTLADFDREMGTITLIYQEVGRTTLDLGRLEAGDYLLDLVGPLGKPSEIEKYGTVVCVGGGVGIAPIYPITRELARAGNKIISIIGARSKDHFINRVVFHPIIYKSSHFFDIFHSGNIAVKLWISSHFRHAHQLTHITPQFFVRSHYTDKSVFAGIYIIRSSVRMPTTLSLSWPSCYCVGRDAVFQAGEYTVYQ